MIDNILVFAILVVAVTCLAIFATGKLVKDDPTCRVIQAVLAIIALIVISVRAGWVG